MRMAGVVLRESGVGGRKAAVDGIVAGEFVSGMSRCDGGARIRVAMLSCRRRRALSNA